MDVSIVIPTFNRRDLVLRTLSTLREQDLSGNAFEIIVVVDGSTDGTTDALKKFQTLNFSCRFRVIEQQNRGPSAARNAGSRAAEAGLLLFIDDDMQCAAGLIAAHVAAHRNRRDIIGFGAIFSSSDSPRSLALECFNREIGAYHLEHVQTPGTPWLHSTCVFSNTSLAKNFLLDAGGFDEDFRVREDLDMGVRLLKRGAQAYYVCDAVAYQYYTKTGSDLLIEAERFALADIRFASKHPGLLVPGHLGGIAEKQYWRDRLRSIMVASPILEKCLLAPLCSLGETFISVSAIRNVGLRALKARRRIRWLRTVQSRSSG